MVHINPLEKEVPCGGSGSAPTAVVYVKGVAKYKMATSFRNSLEL